MKIAVLAIIAFASVSARSDVVIRAPGASEMEYDVYVRSDLKRKSYAEAWLSQRVPAIESQKLKQLLFVAQAAYLGSGGSTESSAKFKTMSDLVHTQDWAEEERLSLQYALMRLAQLSPGKDEMIEHLKKAVALGELPASDQELYPPPLWHEALRLNREKSQTSLDLSLLFPEAKYLLVDGRPLAIQAGEAVPTDAFLHRFTLVRDDVQPETQVMTWAELEKWIPKKLPLVEGDCQSPRKSRLKGWEEKALIFFSADCVHRPGEERLNLLLPEPSPLTTQTVNLPTSAPAPKSNSDWRGSPWKWMAAGALVLSAVVIWQNSEQKERVQPTDTYGF